MDDEGEGFRVHLEPECGGSRFFKRRGMYLGYRRSVSGP